MAWRDKLLIKGLVHGASEYLATGMAAQPTWERACFVPDCQAPLCGSRRLGWDGVLGSAHPRATENWQRVVSLGRSASREAVLCSSAGVWVSA